MPTNSFERNLIDKEKDKIGQENSQLVHQVASFVQGLPSQSDLNDFLTQTDLNLVVCQSDFNATMAIGAANALTIDCIYIGSDQPTYDAISTFITTNTAGTINYVFEVPLPIDVNGKSLHIEEVYLGLDDADVDDYVNTFKITKWTSHTTYSDVFTSSTDRNTIALHTYTPSTVINFASAWKILIRINCSCASAYQLDIGNVRVKSYYA